MFKKLTLSVFLALILCRAFAAYILLPMDPDGQTNHLKAYGITYWILENDVEAFWLLNYRGGSFAFPYNKVFENECLIRGVSYEIIPDARWTSILSDIANPEVNMDAVKLEKPPKIAVYSPKTSQPWDDAVTLVLTYAEIPYEVVYDDEVLNNKLPTFDWLHLHHEDFTGQYGKFYAMYRNAAWYKNQVRECEEMAHKHGFVKVSQHKLAVAHKIRDYVVGGGFLFAMCSATDSYDIALAAEDVDICDVMFDGDPPQQGAQSKLDFNKSFAFQNFKLRMNPYEYEYSDIDATMGRKVPRPLDYFTLFDFSAKWDPVPTMLTQCHTQTVKGFMGQTTSFKNHVFCFFFLAAGNNTLLRMSR